MADKSFRTWTRCATAERKIDPFVFERLVDQLTVPVFTDAANIVALRTEAPDPDGNIYSVPAWIHGLAVDENVDGVVADA
jgi:hypothetical protein